MNLLQPFAKSRVPEVRPAEARQFQEAGALLVDVREPEAWR